MTFIITLISLIIERLFHWSHLRQWRWFNQYQQVIGNRISRLPSWLILSIFILPLVAVAGFINCLLGDWLYSIPKIIFGIGVLVYCMGPDNLWMQTLKCINEIQKEDPEFGIKYAMASFHLPHPKNSQQFHQTLTSAIFIEANKRIFGVVFWFVMLGPLGAVLYRAIALCSEQSDFGLTGVASYAHKLLDWIPARLFTLIFALGGHFVEVLHVWKKDAKTGVNRNDQLIAECGLAALDAKAQNEIAEDGGAEKSALELLDRVFIMSLLILAVLVIVIK